MSSFTGSKYLIGVLDLATGLGWAEGIRGRDTASIVVGLGRCFVELRLDDPAVRFVLLFDRETAVYKDPAIEALILQRGGRLTASAGRAR